MIPPEFTIRPYDDDDDLVAAVREDGRPRFRVFPCTRTAVVLGRGSRPELELKLEACRVDGIPVLRRRGGGCAVVVDPGNVFVSLALPVEGIGRNLEHFERISRRLSDALAAAGAPGVRRAGISDLALEDRKVGGACIQRLRGLLHYAATLLVTPRVDLMERYLKHPPREPDYRRGRTHAEFVRPLADAFPGLGDARELCVRLEAAGAGSAILGSSRLDPGTTATG